MKCVWASVCEAHFEVNVFVLCLMYNWFVLKGKTARLMFCYFLPLLCSPCFPSLIISLPLSLQRQDG